nr:hypothetical protein [Tanacetum cinerariifolium]
MQDDSNRSGNDTDADDADIRPVYDEEPMAEVQLTSECNIFIIGQQRTEQPEIINEGRVDHESRNSSKNMPRFSSNDMVYNDYLDEARKKTQERDRNSKTSVMSSARFQSTADGSKPKRRSTNHSTRSLTVSKSSCITITVVPKADISMSSSTFFDSKHFVCSTCQKCVSNANHDACITKILKEVNSRAKIQSHKTRNRNKPVDQKSHTQKPGRQIFTRHRFSSNKTFTVYEKTSFRYDLRWKPMGRIFKCIGHRWIPTGKLFASCTSKADLPPPDHVVEFPKDKPVHPELAPIILHHAPAQPGGYVNEDDMEEDEEEDPNADSEKELIEQKKDKIGDDNDEEMEMDDEDEGDNNDEDDVEVINPYEEVDPLNRPPPTSDEETKFSPLVVPIADADDEPIPTIIQFGGNNHVRESSSIGTLLACNGWVNAPCLMGQMFDRYKTEKRMAKKLKEDEFHMNGHEYKTEKRMAKKLKEDEFHMNGHEYDITALDTAVRENRSDYPEMMKVVEGLSRQFSEFKEQNRRAKRSSRWEAWVRRRIPRDLQFQEEPPIYPASIPRADNPYVMVSHVTMAAREDDDDET